MGTGAPSVMTAGTAVRLQLSATSSTSLAVSTSPSVNVIMVMVDLKYRYIANSIMGSSFIIASKRDFFSDHVLVRTI